jgi:hypothetical protein
LRSLVELFARIQKAQFIRALSISEGVLKEQSTVRDLIASASDLLRARKQAQTEELKRVFAISKELEDLAGDELGETAQLLDATLKMLDNAYFAAAGWSGDQTDHWYKGDIVTTARQLGYFADTGTYRAWRRLTVHDDRQFEIVVAFHSLGTAFMGIMAASAFALYRDRQEEESVVNGPYALCDSVFQFTYTEDIDHITERFRAWLAPVLRNGLDQWRRQL